MSDDIRDLIKQALASDNPMEWFEALYARAAKGDVQVPWAYMKPNPLLADWLEAQQIDGEGKTALVVGCGLGDDAQTLDDLGFKVTGFDISETAIKWAQERFAETDIDFHVMDLFKTPDAWQGAFDFVLESRTVQALPHQLTGQAISQIASYVAPGGTLLVLCFGRDPQESRQGIPWPLSSEELALFEQAGLVEQTFDDIHTQDRRDFRVVYQRPPKN